MAPKVIGSDDLSRALQGVFWAAWGRSRAVCRPGASEFVCTRQKTADRAQMGREFRRALRDLGSPPEQECDSWASLAVSPVGACVHAGERHHALCGWRSGPDRESALTASIAGFGELTGHTAGRCGSNTVPALRINRKRVR